MINERNGEINVCSKQGLVEISITNKTLGEVYSINLLPAVAGDVIDSLRASIDKAEAEMPRFK